MWAAGKEHAAGELERHYESNSDAELESLAPSALPPRPTMTRSPATAVLTALALGLVLFLGLFVARGMFTGQLKHLREGPRWEQRRPCMPGSPRRGRASGTPVAPGASGWYRSTALP